MKLSKRLQAISDLIPENSKVIDVGADHALLDIYLTKYKNCVCLAIDKSETALTGAIKNIRKYRTTVLTLWHDGLENLKLNDEIIILTGLGTSSIKKILNRKITNDLIISSQTDIQELKEFIESKKYFIHFRTSRGLLWFC